MSALKPAAIVLLIGLPASGKSTFAKLLQKKLQDKEDFVSIHAEYDDLISLEKQKEYAEDSDNDKWKSERKAILQNVDNFISCQNDSFVKLKLDKNANREKDTLIVVIDDNNYYNSMRYEYFQLARKHEISFCQFHLDMEFQKAMDLNNQRPSEKIIPKEVIENMASKLEAPNPLKNSWEQFSFQIPLKNITDLSDFLEMSIGMIEIALNNPIKPLEDKSEEKAKDRAKCTASVIHQADKCLRKLVSDQIKQKKEKDNPDKTNLKKFATHQNAIKDELLEDLKTGFATLPVDIVKEITNAKTSKQPEETLDRLNEVLKDLYDLKINKQE